MKFITTIYFVFGFYFLLNARVGIAEESFVTPHGHTICYCDPFSSDVLPVLKGWEDTLIRIDRFYLYKNHIVGTTRNQSWFVFDEISEKIWVFYNEGDWKKDINKKKLTPSKIKWLTVYDNIESIEYEWFFYSLIFLFPIFLSWVSVIIFLKLKRKISNKLFISLFALLLIFVLTLRYLYLDQINFVSA